VVRRGHRRRTQTDPAEEHDDGAAERGIFHKRWRDGDSKHACGINRPVQRRQLHESKNRARRVLSAWWREDVVRLFHCGTHQHEGADRNSNADARTAECGNAATERSSQADDRANDNEGGSGRCTEGRHGKMQGRNLLPRDAAPGRVLAAWRRGGVVQVVPNVRERSGCGLSGAIIDTS